MQKPLINKGKNPIREASWWSQLTFGWVGEYIEAVHCDYFKTEVPSKEEGKKAEAPYLKMEQLGTLFRPTPDDDSIEQASLIRCEDNFSSLVTN